MKAVAGVKRGKWRRSADRRCNREEKHVTGSKPERREVKFSLATSYLISLEVDENPSSDLGDQDEQQAREVLQDGRQNVW